jgi:coenzyme Q-binding protein COQ10
MTAYRQRQYLQYAAPQLFDLVADVERYPEFMPWVVGARVRHRRDPAIIVDMTIGLGPLRKRFSTVAVLRRPHRIDIHSDDALFARYEQCWTFEQTAAGGTNVECHVDVELRSRVLQTLMGASFDDRAVATMAAYTRRAHRLYGHQA